MTRKHHRKSASASSLGLIAPDHYRNFETIITRNATEYSVRMFEDGKEIAYVDLDAHPIKDWAIVVETICLMHHIPLTRPHRKGKPHRKPRVEGGKRVYDLRADLAEAEALMERNYAAIRPIEDLVEDALEAGFSELAP